MHFYFNFQLYIKLFRFGSQKFPRLSKGLLSLDSTFCLGFCSRFFLKCLYCRLGWWISIEKKIVWFFPSLDLNWLDTTFQAFCFVFFVDGLFSIVLQKVLGTIFSRELWLSLSLLGQNIEFVCHFYSTVISFKDPI